MLTSPDGPRFTVELWNAFHELDRNHDGRLDIGDMQAALGKAGTFTISLALSAASRELAPFSFAFARGLTLTLSATLLSQISA